MINNNMCWVLNGCWQCNCYNWWRIERTNVAVDNEEEAVKVVTSPAICIQHNRDADVGSLDDSTSFSLTEAIDRSGMELEVSCSSGSEGSLLFNQFSFSRDRSISRQLSFCSIRSDCAEQLAKEVALQAMGSSAMEPFFDVGPLSRSSSRSTFLSVPSTRFHRQQQQQQQQQQRWLHSDPGVHPLSPSQTNSYLGSLSSLTSRIYMSKYDDKQTIDCDQWLSLLFHSQSFHSIHPLKMHSITFWVNAVSLG